MVVRVQKWGNSLALRIPRTFALEAGLAEGGPVELGVKRGVLTARPIRAPLVSLKQLLAGVTRSNRHAEADFGGPAGGEAR